MITDSPIRPVFSLIVFCHERTAFLAEALDSVATQDLCGTEVIVFDSSASDTVQTFLANYRNETPFPYAYIRNPSPGSAGHNWRIGTTSGCGDYVITMHDDDRLLPGSLARMLAVATAHPDAVAVAGLVRCFGAGTRMLPRGFDPPADPFELPTDEGARTRALLRQRMVTVVMTCALSREFFRQLEDLPEETLYDLRVITRLIASPDPIWIIPEVLGEWRVHDRQLTSGPYDWSEVQQIAGDLRQELTTFRSRLLVRAESCTIALRMIFDQGRRGGMRHAATTLASLAGAVLRIPDRTSGGLTERIEALWHRFRRNAAKPVVQLAVRPLAWAGKCRSEKFITAMVRIKNEQEFLDPSIRSIIDHVDQVVIVDNESTDSTPEIITRLCEDYPDKVVSYTYPHAIARYGDENRKLASTWAGRRSPALLANFYNWCLERCTHLFILKWDGDTIATSHFAEVIQAFRKSSAQVVWHTGANLHESRECLISGRPFEDSEPRLFMRRFARYTNGLGFCEKLRSPYTLLHPRYSIVDPVPLYVHMKWCKADRFVNMSNDRQALELANSSVGPAFGVEVGQTLERWNLSQ